MLRCMFVMRHVGFVAVGVVLSHVTSAPVHAQAVDWNAPTRGVAIATDSSDSVYTVDYDYNPAGDISVTKRDVNGAFQWAVAYDQTQTSLWERASWIVVDGDDRVLVSGTLMSGYANPVSAASILMKFDVDGNLLWRHVYENSFDGSRTRKCLVDDDNNIYVLGAGSGPAGFGTKVNKFAPDGTMLWTWFDTAGIGLPINFRLTPDNAIVIAGRAAFGSVNGYARITLDGDTVWSRPGVSSLTVGDAAGDGQGNTYLVHFQSITKIGPTGTVLWTQPVPLQPSLVVVGADQRAVVGGFPLSGAGAAFAKVNPNGDLMWTNLDADGPLSLLLHSHMLIDGADHVYLAAGTLFDMAVCKVSRDGAAVWTQTTPSGYAAAIALGAGDQSVFVVGGHTARLMNPGVGVTGDLNGDGVVGGADLAILLGQWGASGDNIADMNGDGTVDGVDLAMLLGLWS